jgi:hypothetical protein
MVEEARPEAVESGLTPVSPGWFVVNAREAAWMNNGRSAAPAFSNPTISSCADVPTSKTFWRVYKRSDVALRYGAGVEAETTSSAEANAPLGGRWRVARPDGWSDLPWSGES